MNECLVSAPAPNKDSLSFCLAASDVQDSNKHMINSRVKALRFCIIVLPFNSLKKRPTSQERDQPWLVSVERSIDIF
jgi:hypothetical protein